MIRACVLALGAVVLTQPALAQQTSGSDASAPQAAAHNGAAQESSRARLDAIIAAKAQANGVPLALVQRVIRRESGYRPGLVGRGGAMGLMQIKVATARGLGYRGPARGLLDPETNLTYAIRYLAGAYQVAKGDFDRAVSHYARGYYYAAKRLGKVEALAAAPSVSDAPPAAIEPAVAETAAPEPAPEAEANSGITLRGSNEFPN